jgi:diguanylate cyclase (GGDEF)-like protein/PAS domain S-box-containing protein
MSQSQAIPSLPVGRPEIADLERDFFDRSFAERLPAEVLDGLLAALVELYPDAPASALTETGVMIDMPETVKLRDNPVMEARAGTDLLAFDEQVLKAWDRVLVEGAARSAFKSSTQAEIKGMLYMLDLREAHGAVVSIAALAFDEAAGEVPQVPEAPALTPRFTTVIKDARANIVKTDEAMTKILGWSAEEMEGRRSTEFIHPDDHALAVDNWMQMLAVPGPGRRVRLRHRRRDDAWVWFEVTNHNHLGDPDSPLVISEMVDISDEMAAHEELRAREQLLDQLAEAAPVGLLQFDAERNVVYTNDRLHQILEVERVGTVAGQLSAVNETDRPLLERALDDVLEQGLQADIEVELHLSSGDEPRFCTIALRPLSDDAGTISGAIACVADVTDGARLREELEKRATFDALTGCYNRAAVMLALTGNIASGDGDRAVIFVDLDGFKQVNDRYSHAVGDEVLSVVARRLQGAVRDGDVVARIGGDEFLVVCPGIGAPEHAVSLAARMASAVGEEVSLPCGPIAPQVSTGVAFSDGDALDAEALVAMADQAMYESKRERRGRPRLAGEQPREDEGPTARAPLADARVIVGRGGRSADLAGATVASPADGDAQAPELALRASNVAALLSALHARDGYTVDHSQEVVSLALAVGRELQLEERELLDLESVALLHDIGKIGISDAVLRKPDKLSEAEWAEMQRHPDIGADIVAAMASLSYLAPLIRAEHERWDGHGYPNGLQEEEIPLLSRIVFVCDAYHAMTSDRPYRPALAHGAALREIKSNAGSQFCPSSAAALTHVLKKTRARPAPAKGRRAASVRTRSKASQPLR